jgi:single-stranded-DNA-specific exonuclease
MLYEWKLPTQHKNDDDNIKLVAKKFNVSPIIAQLLLNRGYTNSESINTFLFPSYGQLENPFLLPGIKLAIERIKLAAERNEKVLIYGDSDVDGILSTVILKTFLDTLKIHNLWHIPQSQGYSLKKNVLEKYFQQEDVKLVIAVDCGTNNKEEVAFAKSRGVDTIIIDHHIPLVENIEACAVVNPLLKGSLYTNKETSATTIVAKVVEAYLWMSRWEYYDKELVALDIETTGLSPEIHEICEISAVKFCNFIPQKTMTTLLKTKFGIPKELSQIHGITEDMCKNAPIIEEVIPQLLQFIGDTPLIIQNADFDLSFINKITTEVCGKALNNKIIDTLKIAKETLTLSSYSLKSLSQRLTLTRLPTHRAYADCLALIELYRVLELIRNNIHKEVYLENIDYIALSNIADVMPMVGENRFLTKKGMEYLATTHHIALKLLLEHANLADKRPTTQELSTKVIPILNGPGRLEQGSITVELLLSDNRKDATEKLLTILRLNDMRKKLQKDIIQKIMNSVMKNYNPNERFIFIFLQDTMHGILGVIANYLIKIYKKPVFLLSSYNGVIRGTGRSTEGINIVSILKECEEMFTSYGGHTSATGFEMKDGEKMVEVFKAKLANIFAKFYDTIKEEDILPIDIVLSENEADSFFSILDEISILEPFGVKNNRPVIMLNKVKLTHVDSIGVNKEHLYLEGCRDNIQLEGTGHWLGFLSPWINRDEYVSLAAYITETTNSKLVLEILDIKPERDIFRELEESEELEL